MDFLQRFWIYQRERFPLPAYGLLVAAISFAGVHLTTSTHQGIGVIRVGAWLTASVVALGFFFQLRVSDEYKDIVDDSIYRPYRPVPRGLIRLYELATLVVGVMVIQIIVTIWQSSRLLPLLLLVWGYLALMRFEFFAPIWLKARPFVYLISHMGIMPLIFLFISACGWLAAGDAPPPGINGFLALGFTNGIVFEIGRKIRAPQDEEPGVETYSALWGRRWAIGAWCLAVLTSGVCAWLAAPLSSYSHWLALALFILSGGALVVGVRFLQVPIGSHAKMVASYSSVATLLIFLLLGFAPLLGFASVE